MFGLTIIDHLRLTFGHVVYRHKAHSRIAFARAQWSRRLRAIEALLMAGVAVSAVGAAFGDLRIYAIVSATLATCALITLLLHLTFDLDRSAQAHFTCATRLWRIREQYQALLSDLADGAVAIEDVRRGRDALMNEIHTMYEQGPAADQQAYQAAAEAVGISDAQAIPDEEIDLFLPKSMQKSNNPAAAA